VNGSDLNRFVQAQAPVLGAVERELAAGRKSGHWIWFIFPQIEGLGSSMASRHYAIRDLAEARNYLAHPTLGNRLRKHVRLLLQHVGRPAEDILGDIDALKFRSCLTLFLEASGSESDRTLFLGALDAFYGGYPDERTTTLLRAR